MKKMLYTLLLLFPTMIFAQDSYKLIQEISIEKSENSTFSYADNEKVLTLNSYNKFYRIDKNTGEIKTTNIREGIVVWYNYDMQNAEITENDSSHYIVLSTHYYTYEGDPNTILYLFDKDLNLIHQETIQGFGAYAGFYKHKEKLYLATFGWDEETEEDVMRALVFNKDMTIYKDSKIIPEGGIGDQSYDYGGKFFAGKLGDVRENYFQLDDNYNMKEYLFETRVMMCDGLCLYDMFNSTKLKSSGGEENFDIINYFFDGKQYYGIYTGSTDEGDSYRVCTYDKDTLEKKKCSTYPMGHFGDMYTYQNKNGIYIEFSINSDANNFSIHYELQEDSSVKAVTDKRAHGSNSEGISNKRTNYANSELLSLSFSNSYGNGNILDSAVMDGKYYLFGSTYVRNGEVIDEDASMGLKLVVYDLNGNLLSSKVVIPELTAPLDGLIGVMTRIGNMFYFSAGLPFGSEDTIYSALTDLEGNILPDTLNLLPTGFYPLVSSHSESETVYMNTNNKYEDPIATYNIKIFKTLYNATINSNKGKVSLSSNELFIAKDVTLNITPDNGYKVKNIIIKDTKGNIIPVSNNTFTMPGSNITIDIEYEEIVINPFTKDNLILVLCISIISLAAYLFNKKQEKFLK